MSEDAIKVMLVDDHTLFRKGLAELLDGRDTIDVVAATGQPAEAARLIEEAQPDALVLDLNMPPHGGLALLRELQAKGWAKPTLILTVSDAEDDLANAMRAGARGYLLKDMEPDDVVDAIQRAVRGETVVAPTMTLKLVNLLQGGGSKNAARENLLAQLTAREREILEHLAQGQSNKAIARSLDISHDTVKLHVRHILSKLNLTSRVEAAVFAVEQKMAPRPK
ncbi:MAG: response regulator [Burkholderiales bacterium]|jgi:two-component system nitrate/nitrite response regulator NarL|uniref:DNA-binding response regulator n=1 Tax=Candidatus Desulfobacillus denitrificans TaxID=2608985 RepID=A0A809R3P1_9PROT|nr:response regulator [Zoogloeaceae bacterium]MBP9654353.1 response regulator [Rhodocyclaceae bacterium]MCZ2175178.1 response regulator [Burkholderiales bacterium]BBO21338.1 DNA-binding response regulator [Candidatus Desulfobacillus denitrificans]GIK46622.1 MAG: DNA-binding response regulator [Betaproteobacteria bacterium]